VAGPLRRLEFDDARFEKHIAGLISKFSTAALDLRGDAYGIGRELIKPAFERAGVSMSQLVEGDSLAMGAYGRPTETFLNGDEVFGYAEDGAGFARFSGTVVNVKRVPAGRRVSYGYTYTTSAETTLALVNLGYADGAARRASSLAPVRIRDHTGVIAGRIAMDQLVVDLGDSEARAGDEAVLWGNPANGEPSITQWSKLTGVPPLALLSSVGSRVARIAVGGSGDAR
jgi:alanine racemase